MLTCGQLRDTCRLGQTCPRLKVTQSRCHCRGTALGGAPSLRLRQQPSVRCRLVLKTNAVLTWGGDFGQHLGGCTESIPGGAWPQATGAVGTAADWAGAPQIHHVPWPKGWSDNEGQTKHLLPGGICLIREEQGQHHQTQGHYPCNNESLFLSYLHMGLKK